MENSVNEFIMPKKMLNLLFNNMTETEQKKYRFYVYKCPTSIHKQLTIDDFMQLME